MFVRVIKTNYYESYDVFPTPILTHPDRVNKSQIRADPTSSHTLLY